jgi:hypothetical protein
MDNTIHISAADFASGNFDTVPKKKKSKYNAKKTWVDGICFDSAKEARFYTELKLLLRAGAIAGFCRQPRFIIEEGSGFTDRATEYVADFIIFGADGGFEIVDVKGMRTDVFKDKMKRFKHRYKGLEVKLR